MLILLPFLVIILIIVAINNIYYTDVKPKDTPIKKQIERPASKSIQTNNYLKKYIKR